MKKKAFNISGFLYSAIRVLLGGLFVYASYYKLSDPDLFAVNLEIYTMFPAFSIPFLSYFIPMAELSIGLTLILDLRGSLALYTILLTSFSLVMVLAIFLGLEIDCGCFGPGNPDTSAPGALHRALYRNMAMMCGILYLYVWRFLNHHQPRTFSDLLSLFRKK